MELNQSIVFPTEEETVSSLKEGGYFFLSDDPTKCVLDVSKYLTSESFIDLELLEFSVKHLCESGVKEILLSGRDSYIQVRGIANMPNRVVEETGFFINIVKAFSEEYRTSEINVDWISDVATD